MQFKHPEILWGLVLLLIPILVHLLQLRRFKKTPFTNVAMLERVVAESKKSQNLKKWLLLFTRLFLLASLVVAFAQPFSSKSDAFAKRETVIYLDNSFSMEAKKNGRSILGKSVQDLIQEIPESKTISLFTNERTFRNVTIKQIQNELLSLSTSSAHLSLDQVQLKAASLFSKDNDVVKDMVLISDLQGRQPPTNALMDSIRFHLVQTIPDSNNNIYIDSLYLGNVDDGQVSLNIEVVGLTEDETLPISLFNGDRLIAKTAVKGTNNERSTSILSIEKDKSIKGRVVIEDAILRYDNLFFFNIDERQKPKVLAISEADSSFLKRIFSANDFEFLNFELSTLNYSLLESQNAVILNGLKTIPSSLSSVLWEFSKNGGTLVVIPSQEDIDFEAYNRFLQQLIPIRFETNIPLVQNISKIVFEHPLFQNVFQKEVINFDYPTVYSFYGNRFNGEVALSFDDGSPFLLSQANCFVFTASLAQENSTFINSPLVVPTFYNIGEMSLKNPSLYQTVGKNQRVDIAQRVGRDNILKLRSSENEFIPLQQSFSNKVQLEFGENPENDGIYAVMDGNDTIQNLSFNYPRNESLLNYLNGTDIISFSVYNNIPDVFEKFREDASTTDYWKWFVIFVLLFAVLELLIQKLLP
ncbi:MAG: BatA domain-containing protein [Bacteroidota bacterium]